MIDMGITRPDLNRGSTREDPEQGVHCPPEPAPDRAPSRAGVPAREGGQVLTLPVPREASPDGRTDLVPVDDAELVEPTRCSGAVAGVREVSGRWVGEARVTVGAALDGSVWRARPAALRDIHARVQRGEWAGDSVGLLVAGRVYGWFALALVGLLYGLAEIVKRPTRLVIAALIVLITVLALTLSVGGGDTARPGVGVGADAGLDEGNVRVS